MIRIGLSIYIVGCALILCTSPIAPFLFSLQGESRHMAMQLLMIKACITWTQGYSETIYYILRAGGDTRSVLCIDGLFTLLWTLTLINAVRTCAAYPYAMDVCYRRRQQYF